MRDSTALLATHVSMSSCRRALPPLPKGWESAPLTFVFCCCMVSAPVVLGIVHSAPLCDCMQVCINACSAAESTTLACMHMGALSLAALLLLMQSHEPATQKTVNINLTAYVIALALHYSVKCTAMHCFCCCDC